MIAAVITSPRHFLCLPTTIYTSPSLHSVFPHSHCQPSTSSPLRHAPFQADREVQLCCPSASLPLTHPLGSGSSSASCTCSSSPHRVAARNAPGFPNTLPPPPPDNPLPQPPPEHRLPPPPLDNPLPPPLVTNPAPIPDREARLATLGAEIASIRRDLNAIFVTYNRGAAATTITISDSHSSIPFVDLDSDSSFLEDTATSAPPR